MGALVSKEHMAKVRRYINYAIEEGGKILCGETVSTPLLEDDDGPDNDGRMSEGISAKRFENWFFDNKMRIDLHVLKFFV